MMEMGSIFSSPKEVIDLTGEDTPPPLSTQRPLPKYSSLFESPVPLSQQALHSRSQQNEPSRSTPQPAPLPPRPYHHRERTLRPANPPSYSTVTKQSLPPKDSAAELYLQARRARLRPQRPRIEHGEVINLISPSPSPQPELRGHPSESIRQSIEEIPAERPSTSNPFLRGIEHLLKPPKAVVPQRRTAASPSPLTARERTIENVGSVENPILLSDDEGEAPVRDLPAELQAHAAAEVLALFTDGSAIRDLWCGCGVAVWRDGHWDGKAVALGRIAKGSYAAEAHGVMEAFRLADQLLGPRHVAVEVYTDHKGIVDELKRGEQGLPIRDQLVWTVCNEGDMLRRRGVQVNVQWVKGHSGDRGNEMADMLARLGAEATMQGMRGQLEIAKASMAQMIWRADQRMKGKHQHRVQAAERRLRKLEYRRQL